MSKLISNSKAMCGIYRAIVVEANETEASVYIPAVHKTQMPFEIDESGAILGILGQENGEVDAEDESDTANATDPASVDPETDTTDNTSTDSTSSEPNSSSESSESAESADLANSEDEEESSEEENPSESEEETTEGEESSESSTDSETTGATGDESSVANTILRDAAGNKMAMQLCDYPVAQLSCWLGRSTLKTGDIVWVLFENDDSEFPVIIGSLGSTLEWGELGLMLGGGSGNPYTAGGGSYNGEYYEGLPSYDLTDEQINTLAIWVCGECVETDMTACKRIASQMANLTEVHFKKEPTVDNLMAAVNGDYGTWYAKSSYTNGKNKVTDIARTAVRECLKEGKRVLPRYVTQFCTFSSEWIINYKEASQWQRGDTVTSNVSGVSTWIFYTFDRDDINGMFLNIMGYYEANYELYKDDDNRKVQSQTQSIGSGGSVAAKAIQEAERIANANIGYVYGGSDDNGYDCSHFVWKCYSTAGANYQYASTGSMPAALQAAGFVEVTNAAGVNLSTGAGLVPGDVLLKPTHTELFYSSNPPQEIGAHGRDSYGFEDQISVKSFRSSWQQAFRYNK